MRMRQQQAQQLDTGVTGAAHDTHADHSRSLPMRREYIAKAWTRIDTIGTLARSGVLRFLLSPYRRSLTRYDSALAYAAWASSPGWCRGWR
jgi:hypothetical protein